jgi:hypothetical protein
MTLEKELQKENSVIISKVLLHAVQAWQSKAQRPKVEFYSGRIMMYSLLNDFGFDAERVYQISELRLQKETAKQIVCFLIGE